MAGISEDEQIDLLFKKFTNTVNANPVLPFSNIQNRRFPFQNFEFSKNLFIDDIPENLDNITYNGLLGSAALDASFGVATDISYEIPNYPLLYYHRIELTNALDGLNNTSWYYPDPNNNNLSLLRGSIPFNYDPINFTYKQLLYSNSNQEEALNSDPLYWLFDYKSGFVQFYGDPDAVTNWVNTNGPPRLSVIVYNGDKGLENFSGGGGGGSIIGGNVYNNLDVSGNISANNLFMNLRQDIGYNGLTQLDTINEAYNNELLGYSISLNNDGSIIVVSAPYALGSVPGSNFAGRVRVYRYNGTSWNIYGNYIEGTIENEYLGISVKINSEGNRFILGSLNKARVYQYNGSSWVQQGSDITGGSNSYHIVSIDSEGNRIAVGEPKYFANRGIVRIFNYDGLEWNEIGTIRGNNIGEYFGGIVELSDDGTKLAITSGLFKDPTTYKSIGSSNGKVTVYNYNGSSWNTYGDIINGNSGDLLGLSLALNSNGNTLVIGSPGNSNNSYSYNGKVIIYNYDNETNVWINVKEITGQVSPQSLGSALSLSSDGKLLAISSAPDYIYDGYNTTSNYYSPCKVEIYHYSNNSWYQIYSAIVENNVEDILGGSVSLSKNGKILGIGVLGLYNVNTYNIYDYVYNEGEINFAANNENISKIISTYDGNESSIKFSTINNNLLEDRLIINKNGIDIIGNITTNRVGIGTTYTPGTGVSISPSNEISIGQKVGTEDSPRFTQLTVGGTPGINQGVIDLLASNNFGSTTAAQIKGLLNGTDGGQIQFFTKEDGDPLNERMSILQNGLVSITTDGVGLLIASQDGVTEQGYIYNSGFGTKDFVIDAAVGSSTKGILFRTGSGNRMRISDTGNVGIGTNNPGARLHVYGGGGVWITNADENITHFNYQNLNTNYIRGTYTEISSPLEVSGVITHRGVSLNETTVTTSTTQITSLEIDQVIKVEGPVNFVDGDENGWVTFLSGANFVVGGSYIIQIFTDDRDSGKDGPWHYNYIYTGVMSWSLDANTNDSDSSQEIPLHGYGHSRDGSSDPAIKLRTLSRSDHVKVELQIADRQGDKPDNRFYFTFKMRRML